MNDSEALEVARMIGELWPSTTMGPLRETFYARALAVVPRQVDAMNAVQALFATERFQPAPAQVVDLALDSGGDAERAWARIETIAGELAARRGVSLRPCPTALEALRSIGQRVGALPVDDAWRMGKLRDQFLTAYREVARGAAARELNPASTRQDRAVGPIDTTSIARKV